MRKNILVVNDDGIDAIGLHKLAEALSEIGTVYICAPHVQQSASGHGITINKLVYYDEISFTGAARALSMEGSPADCVKIGLQIYHDLGIEMDMVFSGFNHGMNLGTDTVYSGTVAAAVEGALCGLPSAALSICSNNSAHRTPENFEAGMALAKKLATSEMFNRPNEPSLWSAPFGIDFIHAGHVIISANIPDLPADEIKGTKVCPLSYRAYDEWFNQGTDAEGRVGYHYSGKPHIIGTASPDESDIIASSEGYITLTPLKFDLTDYAGLANLRAWVGEADS